MNAIETNAMGPTGQLVADAEARTVDTPTIRVGLGATRAALDADRRSRRTDILAESILHALGASGALTRQAVVETVRGVWSAEVSSIAIEAALDTVVESGHVLTQEHHGATRYALSEITAEEVRADHAWVDALLGQFRHTLKIELETIRAEAMDDRTLARLAEVLLDALLRGASKTYEVVVAIGEGRSLSPLEFDWHAFETHLDAKLNDENLAKALGCVAKAILDPDDEFGTDILNLLMTGHVLRGLAVNAGLPDLPGLAGGRLLLDTSCLVYGVDASEHARGILRHIVRSAKVRGVQLFVPRHVEREWESLWYDAEQDLKSRSESELDSIEQAAALLRNPIARGFLERRRTSPGITWQDFARQHRPLDRLLSKEVQIGGVIAFDPTAEDAYAIIRDRAAPPGVSGYRSERTARADGLSCAAIAAWRTEDGRPEPPLAWFVATDRLTEKAYRKVVATDPFPPTVTPESWVVYVAAHDKLRDPKQAADAAHAVSVSATRTYFRAMSASFSIEDTLEVAQVLTREADDRSTEDVRSSFTSAIRDLRMSTSAQQHREQVAARAAEFQRRRVVRSQERARRTMERATIVERNATDLVREAHAEIETRRHAEESTSQLLQEQMQRASHLENELKTERLLQSRRLTRAVFAAIVVVAILLGGVGGWLSWQFVVATGAVVFVSWVFTEPWTQDHETTFRSIGSHLAAIVVLEAVLAWLL